MHTVSHQCVGWHESCVGYQPTPVPQVGWQWKMDSHGVQMCHLKNRVSTTKAQHSREAACILQRSLTLQAPLGGRAAAADAGLLRHEALGGHGALAV